MKKVIFIVSLFVAANSMAFCALNDQQCQQNERMIELQRQQLEQQRAYQQEQLRIQRQQQAASIHPRY